jgi:hypothetical protein
VNKELEILKVKKSLLVAVASEGLMKTQQAGKGLAIVVVICEL